jgi:hypothetical protein
MEGRQPGCYKVRHFMPRCRQRCIRTVPEPQRSAAAICGAQSVVFADRADVNFPSFSSEVSCAWTGQRPCFGRQRHDLMRLLVFAPGQTGCLGLAAVTAPLTRGSSFAKHAASDIH